MDLRYAARILTKSPGLSVIILGSLALGIGANTAIFTVAKQVLFDRLAVPRPEQLQLLTWTAPKPNIVHHQWNDPGPDEERTAFPYSVYLQLRQGNKALNDLFAFKGAGRLSANIDGEAVAVQTQLVSGNYYDALGVHPVLGRSIEPSDDAVSNGGAVATISNALWTTRFGRSPAVVGKAIMLNGQPVTVIGVNPPEFTGAADAHLSPDVFVPFSLQPQLLPQRKGSLLNDDDYWWVTVMGRSKEGVTPETAQASLDTVFRSVLLATAGPEKEKEIPHLVLVGGSRGLNGSTRALTRQTYVLLGLVGLVLLLACANIANLLLARSAARQREMGIRLALGAGRGRILRQVLTESLFLSLLGGLLGLAVGYAVRDVLPSLVSPSWAQPILNGRFDLRVFAYTAGVSIIAGLLFGLAPAWQAVRTNPDLKAQTRSEMGRRKGLANKLIVSLQIGLSTLLIVGATLFVRTVVNLNSVDLGFRADHLLLFKVQLPPMLYRPPRDIAVSRQIEERLATVPGVESVTLSAKPLIANSYGTDNFVRLDRPQDESGQGEAWTNAVGRSFFQTMGIPLLAGRGFDATDTETSQKVAVINRALAQKYFPDTDPLGKTFNGYQFDSDAPILIVGVCGDTRYDSLRKQPPPTYYVPYYQSPRTGGEMTYEVRTRVEPYSLVPSIQSAVQSVDRDTPLIAIRTQSDQISDTIRQEHLLARLTVSFGSLALLLACIGIYGVMTYTVARRTNEIGIRLALGAQKRMILRMILSQAFRITLMGVILGLGAGLILTQLLRAMLFGLNPEDPLAMVGAALLLLAVSLTAAFIPALRASRMEPTKALRYE